MKIPFNRPTLAGSEIDYIHEALVLGQLAGDGAFTDRCQRWLADFIGSPSVLLTHSATAALEMAVMLSDIGPGDEVVMPSFTFVSTANAVVLRGGVPVFVDIRPDTLNIDEDLVAEAITNWTKALIPIHYAGLPSEMDRLNQIAKQNDLVLIEDAAQALGSKYKGRAAGSLGHLAAFSFHETKNLISGEGGALAINDPQLIERAEIIREKGTNRKKFFRGVVDKYTWVDIGSSFLPGELIAAFLYGQLEKRNAIQQDRSKSWALYNDALCPYVERGLRIPTVPTHCESNHHLYYIIMPTPKLRDELIARMNSDNINTPFHYVPLHSSPAGKKFARTFGPMHNTDNVGACLVRLPLYPRMGESISRVVERIQAHLNELL